MQERVKLVWDFRGPDAEHFAVHHEIHLKQFALAQSLLNTETSSEKIEDVHWMATITVNKENMITVRDALRPHRGLKAE